MFQTMSAEAAGLPVEFSFSVIGIRFGFRASDFGLPIRDLPLTDRVDQMPQLIVHLAGSRNGVRDFRAQQFPIALL